MSKRVIAAAIKKERSSENPCIHFETFIFAIVVSLFYLFVFVLSLSLAYGGKILLRESKLRLVRGRRYAIVGGNGVGKTTLMNAISNGKLEGWPQRHLEA